MYVLEDAAAGTLLADVIDDWSVPVLTPLTDLAAEVWRVNLDRQEPGLGDDAQVLGLQSSFNVRNRAVARLRHTPDVAARIVNNTLQVNHRGRVLHIGKAPSGSVRWDVHSIDWEGSGVRLDGAAANSLAYSPTEGTLFPVTNPDPAELKHLHLTWQGLLDGSIRVWVGFPRLGDAPWFAVRLLRDADLGRGQGQPVGALESTVPDFETLQTPEPSVALRLRPAAGNGSGRAPRSP
ncbi:hypothetical protein E9529_11540 [Blastococcus sp. KM273128]|uniref:hypothetical protein n=1 Tax=Blastococcus sp. KM273128 TaxID=2570314 RepID=UPI001F3ED7BE|nr:hypothetical protein [Blastococcus sp. KM273128]MCF6744903.1 hypothetical protein [Blastococcus sp. KM273128]